MRRRAVVAIGGFLSVACLNLSEVDPAANPDGGGSGGTGVADASWDTSGIGGIGGGAAGSGGFVAAACTSCGGGGCECVPEVSQGWAHVRIAEGKLSKCSVGGSAPLVVGSGATDTGCGTCQCGSASGASCGFAVVNYSTATCASTGYYSSVKTQVKQCTSVSGGGYAGFTIKAFGVGGSCSAGTAQPKAPDFAAPKSLCPQTSGGSCGTKGACLPIATSSFEAKACVMFESQGVDVACPPGYPEKLPFSTGFDDTRACGCSCEPNINCNGGSATWECGVGTTNQAGQCKDASTAVGWEILTLPAVSGAGCSPDGVATLKGGKVMASGLRVVCCR